METFFHYETGWRLMGGSRGGNVYGATDEGYIADIYYTWRGKELQRRQQRFSAKEENNIRKSLKNNGVW